MIRVRVRAGEGGEEREAEGGDEKWGVSERSAFAKGAERPNHRQTVKQSYISNDASLPSESGGHPAR